MAQSVETKNKPALSGWPMILGWLAMMIFAFHSSTHMVGAGDTWVAMACGRHFLNHGVDTVEPFSANSHKAGPTEEDIEKWPGPAKWIAKKVGLGTVRYWHPTGWVNQNWLTHVIFYWLTHESPFADADTLSFNTLVYWKFAIYILTVICVYYTGRLLGVNPALSAAFSCFAMFVGRSFFDIRPAGFSNLLVALFLFTLVLATYRNILYIWLIVPLSVFWCNVHGGYIYAFIMLVPFFVLHFLTMLPKRWTVFVHSILLWAVLYVMTYRFLDHKPFSPIHPLSDGLFHLLLLFAAAGLAIVLFKRIKNEVVYALHVVASLILFLSLLSKFFPANLSWYSKEVIKYVRDSRLSFVIAFFALTAMGIIVTFLKDKLVWIKLKGLCHTAAVGLVSLLAVIIFNPFHFTNLTHTFVISVSEHAERWRTVREWHPGFEWGNPVGTGFPFLVLYMLCIGLTFFWLFSRFLLPKFLKAPKNKLEQQKRRFTILSKVLGCAAAVFVCWVVFISLSFLNLYFPRRAGVYRFDVWSFIVCAVFVALLLLSIYKNVHFIYLEIPLILLALLLALLAKGKPGYLGRYFYPFVLIPAFVTVSILASLFSKRVKIKPVNIAFAAAAAVVSLILMVAIFNPFRFGLLFNLNPRLQTDLDSRILSKQLRQQFKNNGITLTEGATVAVEKPRAEWLVTDSAKKYSIRKDRAKLSVYKYGSPLWQMHEVFHLRRMWVPRYEGKYKANYKHLFTVLYVINVALVLLWLALPQLKRLFAELSKQTGPRLDAESYRLAKIDLPIIAIAALTVYMAICSRRFIPIAGIAACPLLALFIDQMVRTIAAARRFHGLAFAAGQNKPAQKQKRLVVPPMPYGLQIFFILVGIAAVAGLGSWWTLKFKTVYLDPWPTDPKLTSVFMRMTASDAKPFYALNFIKDNKLAGKMFNYWTEGGFIAWGQAPDPNTGKTPLQLFMDGRAQAAYERKDYDIWSNIMFGGPVVQRVTSTKGSFSADDYVQVGRWIAGELKDHNVWVVLMPASEFGNPFVRGLERDPNWRLVFFNNKQKLFVDIRTPQARELFSRIESGEILYPNEFAKNLMFSHLSFGKGEPAKGLDFAKKAFKLNRSQAAMQKIVRASGFPELRRSVDQFCKEYIDDLTENRNLYVQKDGYHHRIRAAMVAGDYLQKVARSQHKTDDAKLYAAKLQEYKEQEQRVIKEKRW